MQAVTRTLILSLALLGSACSGGFAPGHPPARNGPKFSVAFPDASELVSTSNPAEAHALLATVPLSETAEHHDELRRVLIGTAELSTDHLLLLTEAVAIPRSAANTISVSMVDDNEYFYWSRTSDGFAPVVDELLLAGIDKLNDPSPAHLGQLVARAQTKETLLEIVDRLERGASATSWDDGSTADLEAMLAATRVDLVRAELCIDALLPAGRLDEQRAQVAIESMGFDDGRLQILRADYGRRQTLPSASLIANVEIMSFDDARIDAAREGAPLVDDLEGSEIFALVESASFDDARVMIASALAEHATVIDPADALQIVEQGSFDDGREELVEALLEGPFPELVGDELLSFVATASFDDGRARVAELLQPHVRPALDARALTQLMEAMSFDNGREELVHIFEADLQALPAEERVGILEVFSFDSARKNAIRQLDW